MTPRLGRGLASLIGGRNKDEAEDIIEQIDSMEEVEIGAEDAQQGQAEEPEVEAVTQEEPTVSVSVTDDDGDDEEEAVIAEEPDEEVVATEAEQTTEAVAIDEDDNEPESSEGYEEVSIDELDENELLQDVEEADELQESAKETEPKADTFTQAEPAPSKPVSPEPEEAPTVQKNTTSLSEEVVAAATAPVAVPEAAKSQPLEATGERMMLGEKVQHVPLGDIEVNPEQPRRTFDDNELDELMQSLDQHGMLQPMVVMEKADGSYQLLAGERRMRAAKKLGWSKVPCVVRENVQGDRHRLELALTENVQRQNLNAIEEALGYKRLNEEYGMSHEEIGQRVGRSRVGITNILRLLQLPADIQRGLIDGKITTGHARAILMIPDAQKQIRFYQHVVDEGLTVRKTENRARNIQRAMKVDDPLRNKDRGRHRMALEYDGQLQGRFGYNARVKFNQNKNRFEVMFVAFSEPEVKELCDRLMGRIEALENVDQDVIDD